MTIRLLLRPPLFLDIFETARLSVTTGTTSYRRNFGFSETTIWAGRDVFDYATFGPFLRLNQLPSRRPADGGPAAQWRPHAPLHGWEGGGLHLQLGHFGIYARVHGTFSTHGRNTICGRKPPSESEVNGQLRPNVAGCVSLNPCYTSTDAAL